MATPVILPKLGNSVESSVIIGWKKRVGDAVSVGEALCEVETDKATVEVTSSVAGVLLSLLVQAGDEVPVLTPIALVGQVEEVVSPSAGAAALEPPLAVHAAEAATQSLSASPRARGLAQRAGLALEGLRGTGPGGRIIERDVQAAVVVRAARPAPTPLARKMMEHGEFVAPERGSGPGGQITKRDLRPAQPEAPVVIGAPPADDVEVVPVKGVRKVIADRMLASLQTTAQLTLTAAADARALLAYRARLKNSPETLGLRGITINDLLLFVTARVLPQYPELNALFTGDAVQLHRRIHLGFAMDTPRGLMVPVLRDAQALSLRNLSQEAKRLAAACEAGKVLPDELNGGTFTVSNLGAFGVETFTPVLNPPQVAILGVGTTVLRAVEVEGAVQHWPHLGLSLTINHQVVDGALGARFLQSVSQALAQIDLFLAV